MIDERDNPQHKTLLDALMLDIPGVTTGQAFGYPAYKVNGKVFAFVGGPGMSLKLPEARAKSLIAARPEIRPFEPVKGVVWKSWVSIIPAESSSYEPYEALFEEAVDFVRST